MVKFGTTIFFRSNQNESCWFCSVVMKEFSIERIIGITRTQRIVFIAQYMFLFIILLTSIIINNYFIIM